MHFQIENKNGGLMLLSWRLGNTGYDLKLVLITVDYFMLAFWLDNTLQLHTRKFDETL